MGFRLNMCPFCVIDNKKAGYPSDGNIEPYAESRYCWYQDLTLAYPEHFSPTYRAYALSCRLAILHGDGLGVLHWQLTIGFTVLRTVLRFVSFDVVAGCVIM